MLLRADAQDETCDVVVLARVTDEGVHIGHNSLQRLAGYFGRSILDAWEEPRFAVFFSHTVDGLDYAIRENEEQVARSKPNPSRRVGDRLIRDKRNAERRTSC